MLTVASKAQMSLLKAGTLQEYDAALRMFERGRAFSRELDARGSFSHLPHKAEHSQAGACAVGVA